VVTTAAGNTHCRYMTSIRIHIICHAVRHVGKRRQSVVTFSESVVNLIMTLETSIMRTSRPQYGVSAEQSAHSERNVKQGKVK